MASLTVKLIMSSVVLAVALAAVPADAAQTRKHKKHATVHIATTTANSRYRGTNLVPVGPIYHSTDYLGDDPDPNIRFQIMRDIGAHYGGEN